MKKIKNLLKFLQKNSSAKYFAILLVACFSISALLRPIVQNALSIEQVSAKPAKAKKNLPIYSVYTEDKKIAISFDAAWGADDTDELLQILEDRGVKTTFFLCGYWIDKYPEEVKKIYEKGHEIGNHSDTHPHSSQLSLEQNKEEIMKVHKKVKDLTGYEMDVYRPPFGEYNDTVLKAAKEVGYHTIQWDVDSLDWKEYGVEKEISHVLNHKSLGNGSIILFHNDAKYTPDALGPILDGLMEKGYKIVPVGELIHKGDYYMDHEGRQYVQDEANSTN